METPNSSLWSELPTDILRSVFERLSFMDFHRSKIVCSNWYSCSKQTSPRKTKSPWLILFPEDEGCSLYNPNEAKVYRTKRDLSRIRFLANSGKWFLVLDSKSNLYIIDLFRLYKHDRDKGTLNNPLVEVVSLGDEALFLDLGITVPSDPTLVIERDSIYFTRHDRKWKPSCPDICVFNLATKTLRRFPELSNLRLKDALWFLQS